MPACILGPELHYNQEWSSEFSIFGGRVVAHKVYLTDHILRAIERNMNAKTKTPKTYRTELLRYVNRPRLLRVDYSASLPAQSSLITALESAFFRYDFMTDPYIVDLFSKQRNGYNVTHRLEETLIKRDTYCYKQLKILCQRSEDMASELGSTVSEWYVSQNPYILSDDVCYYPVVQVLSLSFSCPL